MRANNRKPSSIDRENDSLGQQPSSCNLPYARHEGRSSEDLCRGGRNCREFPDRPIEQVCDGEDARHPKYHDSFSKSIISSRKHHTCHSELSKLHLLHTWKIPQEFSSLPPSPEFRWTQDSFLNLYYRNVFTGIQIRPIEWGDYFITLFDNSFTEVPTLRQALSMGHTSAWVFGDSLPVPNTMSTPMPKNHLALTLYLCWSGGGKGEPVSPRLDQDMITLLKLTL
jgi:hypothetical protein